MVLHQLQKFAKLTFGNLAKSAVNGWKKNWQRNYPTDISMIESSQVNTDCAMASVFWHRPADCWRSCCQSHWLTRQTSLQAQLPHLHMLHLHHICPGSPSAPTGNKKNNKSLAKTRPAKKHDNIFYSSSATFLTKWSIWDQYNIEDQPTTDQWPTSVPGSAFLEKLQTTISP